mgnify:CR=1 FL=1
MLGAAGENIAVIARMMDYVDALDEEYVEGMLGADGHDHDHEHGSHDDHDDHDHDHEEDEHNSDEVEYDEHIWTSPKNAVVLCRAVCDAICKADPANEDFYRANCDDYCAQIEALDARFASLCESAPHKLLVFADRFPMLYFCREFGLDYRAAFHGCSGDTEPSLATIKYLIDKVNDEHNVLSNAADILLNVRGAVDCLTDGDENASALLSHAQAKLEAAAKFDETYAVFAKTVGEACTIVDECARDIDRHLDHCDLDESRFAEVDERLNAYWRIARKFHRSPDELFQLWEDTKRRLSEIEESADLDALRLREAAAKKVYLEKAKFLTAKRRTGAAKLSAAVTAEMPVSYTHLTLPTNSLV